MKDQAKTKEQLINELEEMRQRTAQLEVSEVEHRQAEKVFPMLEEEYSKLFDFLSIGITMLDMKGVIQYCNAAVYRQGGFAEGEFAGKHFSKLASIRVRDIPKFTRVFNSIIRGKIPKPLEVIYQHKDGTTGWTEVNISLMKLGGKRRILVIQNDITERKQAEEALRESQELYRAVMELGGRLGEAIVMLQDDERGTGMHVYMSDVWCDITGYSREELLGISMADLIHPKDRDAAVARHARRLGGEDIPGLIEISIIRKNGAEVPVEVTYAHSTYKGKSANVGFIREIAERKKTETALRQSEEFNSSVLRNSPNPILVANPDTSIRYVNPALEKLTGYSLDELVGQKMPRPWWPEEMLEKLEHESKLAYRRGFKDLEQCFQKKSGERFWIQTTATPVIIDGEFHHFIANWVDITERKQAGEELRQSEERYKAIFELGSDVGEAIIINQDMPGQIAAQPIFNDEWIRITGYNRDELLRMSYFDLIHPEQRDAAINRYHRRLQGERIHGSLELTVVRKDGTEIPIETAATLTSFRGQNATIVYARDITERRQAEEALHLRAYLLNNATDSIMASDLEGNIIYANDTACRVHGYTKEEMLEMNLGDTTAPELLSLVPGRMQNVIEKGYFTFETEHRRKDGSTFPMELTSRTIHLGDKVFILSVQRDITERKQVENELQKEQVKLKEAQALSRIGSWEYDVDSQELIWADETYVLYERDPALGPPTVEEEARYYSVKQVEMLRDYAARSIQNREEFDYDVEVILPSGRKGLFTCTMRPIMNESGRVIELFGTVQDITERKRAEERIIVANERVQYLLSSSPAVIYSAKTSGDYGATFISNNVTQLVGYEPQEFTGNSSFWIERIHPDDVELVYQAVPRLFEQEQYSYEYRFRHKDGVYIWVRDEMKLVRDEEGKPLEIIGYWADITERKQTEDRIRIAEENFRNSLDNSPLGIRIISEKGELLYANKAIIDIYGYSNIEELNNTPVDKRYTPKSYAEWQQRKERRRQGEYVPSEYEITIIRKDGTIRHLSVTRKEVIWNNEKQFQAVYHDITERKQAEAALAQSEEKFRGLIETTSDFIWEMDTNGVYTYCSPQIERLWGLKPEEMLGKTPFDLLPPEERGQAIKAFSGLLESSSPFMNMEARSLDGTGQIVFLEISGVPFYDIEGKLCGYRGISRDVTERKQAEDAIKRAAEEWRKTFDSITDSVFICDNDYKLVRVNKAFADTFKMKPEELIGKRCYEIVHGTNEPKPNCPHRQTINTKEPAIVEFFEPHLGLYLEVAASPLFNEKGEVIACIHISRDITERKQAEEREQQLQQELNLASRLATVGQMSSGIAHEINNPLTGVLGFSDLLMKKDLPDNIRKDVNIIYEGAKRIASITNRMLTFARQHKPERTSVNINDIIEATLVMRVYEMESSNIKVTTQLASDIPLTFADAGQLQQVFLNIILNAEMEMKLAHSGGNLTIKSERIDNTIQVSFKDDGPGIPKKYLDKMFDPFFTTRDPDKGTGLGLSICYSIVTQHGGKIYAESRLGKGATFFVELPIVTEEKQLELAEPTIKESETVSAARILVVDDDTIVQQFLTETLTKEGHEVEIVDNGDDAMERLGSEDYDVILLDIKLPGKSGTEIYEHLQKSSKSLARRVIFITGDTMSTDTMVFVKSAQTPYIAKPFDAEQLKKEINHILSR